MCVCILKAYLLLPLPRAGPQSIPQGAMQTQLDPSLEIEFVKKPSEEVQSCIFKRYIHYQGACTFNLCLVYILYLYRHVISYEMLVCIDIAMPLVYYVCIN